MRRTVATVTVIGIVSMMSVAVAAVSNPYADDFSTGDYQGNNGSHKWASDWEDDTGGHTSIDVDTFGSCESGPCLRVNAPLLSAPVGARRSADTSIFTNAEISYVAAVSLLGTLEVEVSRNGGGNWTHLITHNAAEPQRHIDIPEQFLVEDFAVRFVASGVLGATVYIDDVEISGDLEIPPPPTATTTTKPTTTTTTLPSITVPSITVPTITIPSITTTTRPTTTTTTTTTDRPTTTTKGTVTTATSSPETPTTEDRGAPTTTVPGTTTSTSGDDDETIVALGSDDPPSDGGGGLHQATRGIQAGLSGAMFADVSLVPMFDPVDVDFSFGLVAEEIETSWLWMSLFGLVLAWALISDLDRRRKRLPRPGSSLAGL